MSILNSAVFWVFVAVTVVGCVAAVLVYRFLHTQKRDDSLDDKQKLEQMLKDTGYSFDDKKSIFYARTDAWQKKYGYCQLYDEAMAPLSMIVDCEPVRFDYNNEKWLIELWKGEYGITTGGEIGIYKTEDQDLSIPEVFSGTFYHAILDEDWLLMSMTLRKGDQILFQRRDRHWWLTGFVLGEFSEPGELVMDAGITLKDDGMRRAFVNKLIQMGYSGRKIRVVGNTVHLIYDVPHSPQPYTRADPLESLMQKKNRYLCEQYMKFSGNTGNMYEALNNVRRRSPELYDMILSMGKSANLLRAYDLISGYLEKKGN